MTSDEPFDTSVAHQARIYNYVLGGKDNYAADRAAAEAWMEIYPQLTSSRAPTSLSPESSRLRNGCQIPARPHLAIHPYGAP